MCRSIKTLHNFDPPATDEEIRASSLQFVRKLSGFLHDLLFFDLSLLLNSDCSDMILRESAVLCSLCFVLCSSQRQNGQDIGNTLDSRPS